MGLVAEATKSIPDPVSDTAPELPVELVNRSVPVRVPAVAGEKLTCTVQLPLAATELQLLAATAKSPVACAPLIFIVALLAFVTVTFCAAVALPTGEAEKLRLEGLAVNGPGPVMPVPDKVTV